MGCFSSKLEEENPHQFYTAIKSQHNMCNVLVAAAFLSKRINMRKPVCPPRCMLCGRAPNRSLEVSTFHFVCIHSFYLNTNINEFIVGDLVISNGQKLGMAIEDKHCVKLKKVMGLQSTLIVRAQELDDNHDEVEFEFAAKGLFEMDTFRKIDPWSQWLSL